MSYKQTERWKSIRAGQWKRGRMDIVKRSEEMHERRPMLDGTGITETPGFGKLINGVPITEVNRIQAEAREAMNELEQEGWRDLANNCSTIGAIEKPRLRAMVAEALLTDMHYDDPPDIEQYAEFQGISVLEAAEELSKVGDFEEKPYGIVTGEIHFDNDDIPEPEDDDDEWGDSLEIASVEA